MNKALAFASQLIVQILVWVVRDEPFKNQAKESKSDPALRDRLRARILERLPH